MKTGVIDSLLNPLELIFLIKSKPSNIRSKLSSEDINTNIDKYGFWGAYTEREEREETLETPKKKVKNNTYNSPEHNQCREKIDSSELENIGKKYHIAMKELCEREQKEKQDKIDEDKFRCKIALLKEKMKKSKDTM